jgi:hypothetical protein
VLGLRFLDVQVADRRVLVVENRLDGPVAHQAATDSFPTGYDWAMSADGVALAAGAVAALTGLRVGRPEPAVS